MKGSALCSSFATGKFAMRALAQSLAREFGPKGVHVVHAIIDGVIDIERTKDWKFEHEDAKIKPEAVSTIINRCDGLCKMLMRIPDRGLLLVSPYTTPNMLHASIPLPRSDNH